MQFVFTNGNNKYVFDNGKVYDYNGKLKIKDDIIGYLVMINDGQVKQSKIPVYDCSKREVTGKLIAKMDNPSGLVFETKDSPCILFNNIDLVVGKRYHIIYGSVIEEGNINDLINAMNREEIIDFALKQFKDNSDIVRNAIISYSKLGKCEKALELYASLDKKFPEESLAAAECYTKLDNKLEALKIYSFFSDEKYRELENEMRKEVNNMILDYENSGNLKILYKAMNYLPTYDAPALKLGFYYFNKNPNEAVKNFEEALRRSRSYQNMIILANSYIKAERYMDALKLIEKAEKIRRTGSSAYIKGLSLLNLNDKKAAEKEFIYACREGVVEACEKANPSQLYYPKDFTPEQWIGYVIYGYEAKKVIGNGGMGYVLLVERNNKQFAMKIMKKEYNFTEMLYEVAKMQEISKNSKYMVRILASFIDENWVDYFSSPPAILMEYMEGGDLRELLVREEFSSLRHSVLWPQIVSLIFSRIVDAVIKIHKEGYVHCDIKPSNILFSRRLPAYGEDGVKTLSLELSIPKLSDLGSAVKIGVPVVHYTPYYAHPLQRFGQRATTDMDVYSFTVSLFVTLTNNFPFPEWLEREIEEAVNNPSKRDQALKDFYSIEPKMDYVPDEYRELILRGLRGEITLEEIKSELRQIKSAIYDIRDENVFSSI
ncbi:protein kinase [Acidianus sp. RZ1]|uniref:protein kinase domain-containing protein n=1 Tax=Acidianus sp. RZ1 TaxID=1540082 RepID=UPI0014914A6A|nr:protein kinase [Acidianus sp. RZ1]NON63030.1 protein kinase [Acidianus sp. RZ1]